MPRLRHATTGVIVNVDEGTAAGLGSEWGPVEEKTTPPAKRPLAVKATPKSEK